MSWKCSVPECQFENDDASVICACCGRARKSRLELRTPAGAVWRTRIDADVTRSVYRRLYPGVEHQYVPRNEGEHPFSLVRDNLGAWQIVPNPASLIATVLNGSVCEGVRRSVLKPNDVIAIAPKGNPAKTFAPLTVVLVPVE